MRLVIVADPHCGHWSGLTPPAWLVTAKRNARWRSIQQEAWRRYSALVDELRPVDVLLANGDLIDGRGEKSGGTELLTTNRDEQCAMARQCLRLWDPGEIAITYGTPYHAGQLEDFERSIADDLGATIHAQQLLDVDGVRVNAKHHAGGSQVPSGGLKSIADEKIWDMLWSEYDARENANLIVRSHVHVVRYVGGADWLSLTTPCLELATKFGARRCRQTVDWGVVVVDTTGGGRYTWQAKTVRIKAARSAWRKIG